MIATNSLAAGEIVSWESGMRGAPYQTILEALDAAGLDIRVARPLIPRNAFARAASILAQNRIIRMLDETAETISFQFTAEEKDESAQRLQYRYEAILSLNKRTGLITGDDPVLAEQVKDRLDQEIAIRHARDITAIVQKLFRRSADLFSVRPAGGVYFVPDAHRIFVDKIKTFLSAIGGKLIRFAITSGDTETMESIQDAVEAGLRATLSRYSQMVDGFGEDTRESTLEAMARRLQEMDFKTECYTDYLAEARNRLEAQIEGIRHKLRARVTAIAVA